MMIARDDAHSWFRCARACVALLLVTGISRIANAQDDGASDGPPEGCAEAAGTRCDDPSRPWMCCQMWFIDVTAGGKKSGGLLEDSFAKVTARVERERKTYEHLCRYFKDASDCDVTLVTGTAWIGVV